MAYSAVMPAVDEAALVAASARPGAENKSTASPAGPTHNGREEKSTWQAPEQYFERRMFTDGVMTMPDGAGVPYWGFEDPIAAPGQKTFPSPVVRMRVGEVAHVKLETLCDAAPVASNARTGPRNGGLARGWGLHSAGALAVQKRESYIYQWQPKQAGTWLYQSHLSSARHFEMGLFGLLIVDPEPESDGLPRAYRGGPAYNVERCWILDDIDPDWHAGAELVSGGSGSERERPFVPKYFLINGVPNTEVMNDERVAINAKAGDKVLIRLLNASFSLVRLKIEGLQGQIISVDGNALASAAHPWTKWSPVKPTHPVYLATGARNDILIDLDPEKSGIVAGGDYLVTFEFLDWEKRAIRNAQATSPVHVGRAVTRIRVT